MGAIIITEGSQRGNSRVRQGWKLKTREDIYKELNFKLSSKGEKGLGKPGVPCS